MYFAGIDIGSTASKTVLLNDDEIIKYFVLPTGWSSKETAANIKSKIDEQVAPDPETNIKVIATGYGRVSVPYADKVVTEITCHARGAYHLYGKDCTVIDIGGQDTKVIVLDQGTVKDFLMNDKCSAGTGKFLEIMASRLGVTIEELFNLASNGKPLAISSMCTVFAESEIISHIGEGEPREDIAAGIIDSVINKVANLANRTDLKKEIFLSGGLCDSQYIIEKLSEKLNKPVFTDPLARYAGALGAALIAKDKYSI